MSFPCKNSLKERVQHTYVTTYVTVVNAEQNHSLDLCSASIPGMPGIAIVRSGYGPGLSLFNHTTRKLISYDRHRIFTRPKFENINRTIVEIISRYFLQVMYSVNAFVAHFNSVIISLQFHCNIDSNFCNYILLQFSLLFLRFYNSKKTQFLRHPYILLNDLFRT